MQKVLLLLLKLSVGAVCFIAGGAVFLTGGAGLLKALSDPAQGAALTDLAGTIVGAAIVGAGLDLCGLSRRAAASRDTIANSVWATPAHLKQFNITRPKP